MYVDKCMYVKLEVLLSSIAAYSLASELERWHYELSGLWDDNTMPQTQHLSKWFLGGMYEKSMSNVRILWPPSNRQASFSVTYKKHEKKKSIYILHAMQRVRDVEFASFLPLVLSAVGSNWRAR